MYLQEFYLDQDQPSASVACPQVNSSTTFNCELADDSVNTLQVGEPLQENTQSYSQVAGNDGVQDISRNEVSSLNPRILEAHNKFELLFKSRHINADTSSNPAAKRCLVVYDKSGSKIVEVNELLQESSIKTDVTSLEQVSA